MSHFSTIKTKIMDKECLIEALKKLGFSNIRDNVNIHGYGGTHRHGDVVIKTGSSYDIGFVKGPDGSYKLVADWWGIRNSGMTTQKQFLNNIQKKYSTLKVIKTVKKKGFRVLSQRETETDEIKLVVVRRGGYVR